MESRDYKFVYDRDMGLCYYCGIKVENKSFDRNNPHGFDHLRPKSKGGTNESNNLVVCCGECNTRKGKRIFKSQVELKAFQKKRQSYLKSVNLPKLAQFRAIYVF